MYDRLLKLLEGEKWRQGDRVDPKYIRGNRMAPGMMGGMRSDDNLNASVNRRKGGPTPPKPRPKPFDKLR